MNLRLPYRVSTSHSLDIVIVLALTALALTTTPPALAGGNPADGMAMPEDNQLMVINGTNRSASEGDFVSASDGLDAPYSFGIEVPLGTPRLQIELFDPDVAAGDPVAEETAGRDLLVAVADTVAHYLLLDPDGLRVPVQFALGDGVGPADNAWATLFDSSTAEASGAATYADDFSGQSYDNDDGTGMWSGDWTESNELGLAGPLGGQIQITAGGQLRLTNESDFAPFLNRPGLERPADLATAPRGVLSFDWSTEGTLEDDDAFVVEASADDGVTWTGLGLFSGFASGPTSGSAAFDLTGVAGANTRIRFRVYESLADAGEAILIDNVAIQTETPAFAGVPKTGTWRLIVDMSSAVNHQAGQQDETNAFALRAHDGDPGPDGTTEVNVYSESYLPIGGTQAVPARSYTFYPYVTEDCNFRLNEFDYDSSAFTDPASPGVWTLTNRLEQDVYSSVDPMSGDNLLSDDHRWLSTEITTDEYGIVELEMTIQSDASVDNRATVYLGDFESADPNANGDGTPGPTASPETGALRLYLPSDDGSPPGKPFLVHPAFYVEGPNPPAQGQTTRYVVNLRLGNPENANGPLVFAPGQGLSASVPGSTADAEICFAGTFPGSPVSGVAQLPTGCGGDIFWEPEPIDPGNIVDLIYFVDVTPSNDTWPFLSLTGTENTPGATSAQFIDAMGRFERLGDLCAFRIGPTVSLGEARVIAQRTPTTPTTVAEGGTVEYDLRIESRAFPGFSFELGTLLDDALDPPSLDGRGTCTLPQLLPMSGSFYECDYSVVARGDAGEVVTTQLTFGGSTNGPVNQETQTFTIVDAAPAYDVTLTPEPAVIVPNVPTNVRLTLEVTNTSFADPMFGIQLSDSLGGPGQPAECLPPLVLAPGDRWECVFFRSIDPGGVAGQETVTVSVAATDDEGTSTTRDGVATIEVPTELPFTVDFVGPSPEALWFLSPPASHGDPAEQEVVTLAIHPTQMGGLDPVVCQIVLELRTDEGASDPDDLATWPLTNHPLGVTVGGPPPCTNPVPLTDSLWDATLEVPTQPPSGIPGSRYRLKALVTDFQGETQEAFSNAFRIDRQRRTAARTLILTHRDRLATYAAPPADLAALDNSLWDFAGHPAVQGVVVDLGPAEAVRAALDILYDDWDDAEASAPETSFQEANQLLFDGAGIQALVRELDAYYPSLRDVLIVGDDRIVPFARLLDRGDVRLESLYGPGVDGDHGIDGVGSPIEHALMADQYLSDDPLVTLESGDPVNLPLQSLYTPQSLGVGRLVETLDEMVGSIRNFLDLDGVLDLDRLDPTTGNLIQITGYDFLIDGARQSRDVWFEALRPPAGTSPLDGELISLDWGSPMVFSDRLDALMSHLAGNGGDPYGLIQLFGHSTHYQEGVPASSEFVIDGLDAACLTPDTTHCNATMPEPFELAGSFVFSQGCHGGLTVPGSSSDPNDPDHSLDLAQTYLAQGALGYLASTGYSYGSDEGVGFGERFAVTLSEELVRTDRGRVALGDLVRETKERYYLESSDYDRYDTKTLYQQTLYGFPMAEIILPSSSEGLEPKPTLDLPPAIPGGAARTDRVGGLTFERRAERASGQEGASNLLIETNRLLIDRGLYTKFAADGTSPPAGPGCNATDADGEPIGCYYTFTTLGRRATDASDLPIQPYTVTGRQYSGTSFRGVLWNGGIYDEESGWRATITTPQTNNPELPEGLRTTPRHSLLGPVGRAFELAPGGATEGDAGEPVSLVLTLGEVIRNFSEDDSTKFNRQRLYRALDLEVFFHTGGPHADDLTGPEFFNSPDYHVLDPANPGLLGFRVPVRDLEGDGTVWRVVVVYNDASLEDTGDGFSAGSWDSLELELDVADPSCPNGYQCFAGSVQIEAAVQATYALQAIDPQGNVSWRQWEVVTLPDSRVMPEIPDPIDVLPALVVEAEVDSLMVNEPAATVPITVRVKNVGGADFELETLERKRTRISSLDGVGTCSLPQTVKFGGEYVCVYDLDVEGSPGDLVVESLRASARASDGRVVVPETDPALTLEFQVVDVAPDFRVTLVPDPTQPDEPGGLVSYTVTVNNDGPEPLRLMTLSDDEGPLDGRGDCIVSTQPILAAEVGVFTCTYDGAVGGNAGSSISRTVLAGLQDDDQPTIVQQQAVAEITLGDVLPTLSLSLVNPPATVDENATTVDLQIEIENTSVETVDWDEPNSMDLTALGCDPPVSLAVGEIFPCTVTLDVTGRADRGDQIVTILQALVYDDDNGGNPALAQALVTIDLVGTDWGDAPAPYPTLGDGDPALDGARHPIVADFYLGAGVDSDPGGQPSPNADGDDGDGRDDEDGVVFTTPLVPGGSPATIEIVASLGGGTGLLDAWIDWDANGDWNGADEQILLDEPLNEGLNIVQVDVPVTAATEVPTLARFRLESVEGSSLPTGSALDGEVEDVVLTLLRPDLRIELDSPPTIDEPGGTVTFDLELENTGTAAIFVTGLSGLPNPTPAGCPVAPFTVEPDDAPLGCSFDVGLFGMGGDSVTFTITASGNASGAPVNVQDSATTMISDVQPTLTTTLLGAMEVDEAAENTLWTLTVQNTSVEPVVLDRIVDGDGMSLESPTCFLPQDLGIAGTFDCFFEQAVVGQADQGDTLDITVTAEAFDDEGSRGSSQAMASAQIRGTDWGDAPANYPTVADPDPLLDGARHTIVAGFFLGGGADAELAGQPTSDASGDDASDRADESGVTFLTPVVPTGNPLEIDVSATLGGAPGVLDAWIDWNFDGDWNDPGEWVLTAEPLNEGSNLLSIAIAPEALPGASTFARFRLSSSGVSGPGGPADAGEVEDYPLTIEMPGLFFDLASPPTLLEPGGAVPFDLLIDNGGTVDLVVTQILGVPSTSTISPECETPFPLQATDFLTCTFNDTLEGTAGDSLTHEVTLVAEALGAPLTATDDATTVLVDALPSLAAVLEGPEEIDEASPTIPWALTLENLSVEPIELTELNDGGGNPIDPTACPLPQTLEAGATFGCMFDRAFVGRADQGDTADLMVNALAFDDEGNDAPATDTVSIPIVGTDWGDAPGTYETDGDEARHTIAAGFYLGAGVDSETMNLPGDTADGDDDDGIVLVGSLIAGNKATFEVEASLAGGSGRLDGWIDWNGDGDWDDAEEQIFLAEPLREGSNTLTLDVPEDAPEGTDTFARFRLSSNGFHGTSGGVDGGEVEDYAVMILDVTPPTITALELVPGGPLTDCLGTGASPVVLEVVFSETMADPAGDVDPNDVTNPDNYRLLAAGPDRELQTEDCGPIQGDDQELTLTEVLYDPVADAATLPLAGGQALTSDLFRFVICDDLTDPTGNLLDGDGDSVAGGVLDRTFRVDAFNLLGDGHFDCDLGIWDGMPPGEIVHSTDDHQASGDSGSALVDNQTTTTQGFSLGQCVELTGDSRLLLRSLLRVELASINELELAHSCDLYGNPLCDVASALGTRSQTFTVGDSGGSWIERDFVVNGLAGASSAWCAFDLLAADAQDFAANLDALFLGPIEPIVFLDGFESGDTSEWSSTTP